MLETIEYLKTQIIKKLTTLKLVDEYNTSKLCCKCESETEKVSYNTAIFLIMGHLYLNNIYVSILFLRLFHCFSS